jgi:ammonia channel protein AmtB
MQACFWGVCEQVRYMFAYRRIPGLCFVIDCDANLQPWAALVIGLTSGIVYVGSSRLVSHVLRVDDPLDAAAVHGFCGAWGLLMAAAFAHPPNIRMTYGTESTLHQYGHGTFFRDALLFNILRFWFTVTCKWSLIAYVRRVFSCMSLHSQVN